MKKRYIFLLTTASFFAGAIIIWALIQPKLNNAIKQVENMNSSLLQDAEIILMDDSIPGLEAEINLLKIIIDLDNRGAPRVYINEQYISILTKSIEKINNAKKLSPHKYHSKKADALIIEAKKLIINIDETHQ
jgi:hypothetical protein